MDYTLENVPGREFGSIFLTEKTENLALSVVSAGWSKVCILSCVLQLKLASLCMTNSASELGITNKP